tara:strand:- start:132 stop:596 length:465 start_codon:yes stop_codon:yes gene_type:complete
MVLKEYKDGVPTGREYMSEEDALKKKHQDMYDSNNKRKEEEKKIRKENSLKKCFVCDRDTKSKDLRSRRLKSLFTFLTTKDDVDKFQIAAKKWKGYYREKEVMICPICFGTKYHLQKILSTIEKKVFSKSINSKRNVILLIVINIIIWSIYLNM